MDTSIIRQYLVKLGFHTDASSKVKFDEALRLAAQNVGKFTSGMTRSFIEAGIAVTGVLTGIAAGTVAMMAETAKSDLGFQLLARRMYMTTDAARQMKIGLDALGYSIEEVIWGPPELRDRYKQLIADQRQLAGGLGGASFETEMKKIRDISFEFTRLRVEAQYFVMGLTKSLSIALTGDENGILKRLRGWNEWLIKNIPTLADKFSGYLVPVLRDVGAIWKDIAEVGSDVTSVLISFIGELSDDAKLKTGKVNIDNIGRSFKFVADETRKFADAVRDVINDITALNSIKVPWWLTPNGPYEKIWGQGTMQPSLFGSQVKGPLSGNSAGPLASQGLAGDIRSAITAAARNAGVDPALALAIASKESGMNPNAPRGAAGEYGMMQVMPGTFAKYGSGNPADFQANLMASMNYLRHLQDQFHGNEYQMARAYNGRGPVADAYAKDVMSREAQFGPVTFNIYGGDRHEIANEVEHKLRRMAQRQIVQAHRVYA